MYNCNQCSFKTERKSSYTKHNKKHNTEEKLVETIKETVQYPQSGCSSNDIKDVNNVGNIATYNVIKEGENCNNDPAKELKAQATKAVKNLETDYLREPNHIINPTDKNEDTKRLDILAKSLLTAIKDVNNKINSFLVHLQQQEEKYITLSLKIQSLIDLIRHNNLCLDIGN